MAHHSDGRAAVLCGARWPELTDQVVEDAAAIGGMADRVEAEHAVCCCAKTGVAKRPLRPGPPLRVAALQQPRRLMIPSRLAETSSPTFGPLLLSSVFVLAVVDSRTLVASPRSVSSDFPQFGCGKPDRFDDPDGQVVRSRVNLGGDTAGWPSDVAVGESTAGIDIDPEIEDVFCGVGWHRSLAYSLVRSRACWPPQVTEAGALSCLRAWWPSQRSTHKSQRSSRPLASSTAGISATSAEGSPSTNLRLRRTEGVRGAAAPGADLQGHRARRRRRY